MDRQTTWSMYFAGIVAFMTHPGAKLPPDLQHAAFLADEMLKEQEKRKWDGSDQPSQP